MVDPPAFHLVCRAAALEGAPEGWAAEMLGEGQISLLADQGGLAGIDQVAHALGLSTVSVVRSEPTVELQEETVMAHAGSLPLVWAGASFGEQAREWAHRRGPMTLLVEAPEGLSGEQRDRIDRFVGLLTRQAE